MPYTRDVPEAIDALWAATPYAERIDVSDSILSYWRLVAELWAAQEDFVIVEHDIAVRPDVIGEFEQCPNLWCDAGNAFWCVRFRSELMTECPGLPGMIVEPYRRWECVATALIDLVMMKFRGRLYGPDRCRPHIHEPLVRHLATPDELRQKAEHYAAIQKALIPRERTRAERGLPGPGF